jgi:hypothetical protein
VPGGELPAAGGPQPVGDRAGDLAFAGARRPDKPQEGRLGGLLHVQQRARQLVDGLAVQQRWVDPLAVGQFDRLAGGVQRQRFWALGGQVALGGDLVDLV